MGNFETKNSPYYAITDETSTKNDPKNNHKNTTNNSFNNLTNASTSNLVNDKNSNNHESLFWITKRANFDSKNSSLFEYNNQKNVKNLNNKQLGYALNQIKTLKKLRHPNIVKYFYSEEPPPSQQQSSSTHVQANLKCLVITEFIRPVSNLIDKFTSDQIMHGIFGITNAIQFLHEKAKMSHNNLSEECIYVNCKQVWKLNDFELALSFENLSHENLKNIYKFKKKNAITPEEEANFTENKTSNNPKNSIDLNRAYQESPHAIDSYGWALTILNLLPQNNQTKSFKDFFGDENNDKNDQINHDNKNNDSSEEQLERYLSTEPTERPNLKLLFDMKLFDLYKIFSDTNDNENSIEYQLYRIDNLDDLESNFKSLLDYLSDLKVDQVNEKLIDFLLQPFMFFSERIRKEVFPLLFIPMEVYVGEENFQSKINFQNFYFSVFQNYVGGKCMHNEMTMGISIEPFMNLSKYKTFVIPRILNLLTMHSTQIRLVLLEYFPFYINYINDDQSLHYEILPELLLGLKDKNDELVSLTFSCLSIVVKILGSEIVVGKKGSSKIDQRQNIFSDNLPKVISKENFNKSKSESRGSSPFKSNNQNNSNRLHKNKSEEFNMKQGYKENLGFSLNEKAKFSSATSLDEEIRISDPPKLISDSMIALHGEETDNNINSLNGDTVSTSSSRAPSKSLNNEIFSTGIIGGNENNKIDEDEWSNDFGWNNQDQNIYDTSSTNQYEGEEGAAGSASLLSLAGSVDLLVAPEIMSEPKIQINHSLRNFGQKPMNYLNNNNGAIGSEYDIKNIVITKMEENDPINDFFNDMQPVIQNSSFGSAKKGSKSKKSNKNDDSLIKNSDLDKKVNQEISNKLLFEPVMNDEVSWECEDLDLDI